jgi:hypothetical protein
MKVIIGVLAITMFGSFAQAKTHSCIRVVEAAAVKVTSPRLPTAQIAVTDIYRSSQGVYTVIMQSYPYEAVAYVAIDKSCHVLSVEETDNTHDQYNGG